MPGATLIRKDTAMPDLSVIWEDNALKMLERLDRYTRSSIREEFRAAPMLHAREFDSERRQYFRPVAGGRFAVVWRRAAADQAIVSAVVPITNYDPAAPDDEATRERLKSYVTRVVAAELERR